MAASVAVSDGLTAVAAGDVNGDSIPDLVVEADGYTMEFIGPTLLCLDIIDPGALGRLLAEPIKQQLPVGLGD